MKIKEGFKLRSLGSEFVVLGEGLEQVNFNKMVALNSSAAYLWQSVEGRDFTVEDLRDLLLSKYEVDEQTASADAAKLASSWVEVGVVEQ